MHPAALTDERPTPPTQPGRGVAVVAHRGASAYAPENTLAAIRRAIACDADLVEVDVQRTLDGELVLMHDRTLVRTTNVRRVFPRRRPWRVGDFTLEELRRLDAGSWKSPLYGGERIPTLTEAIEVLRRSRTGLLLELKQPELYPGLAHDVVATLRRAPGYLESALPANRLVVQSFCASEMRTHKSIEPSIPVGLLGRPRPAELPEIATWAHYVNPSQHWLDAGYVAEVHRSSLGCMIWTVDHRATMRRLIRMGVDGVITNRPDQLSRTGRRCTPRSPARPGC